MRNLQAGTQPFAGIQSLKLAACTALGMDEMLDAGAAEVEQVQVS